MVFLNRQPKSTITVILILVDILKAESGSGSRMLSRIKYGLTTCSYSQICRQAVEVCMEPFRTKWSIPELIATEEDSTLAGNISVMAEQPVLISKE